MWDCRRKDYKRKSDALETEYKLHIAGRESEHFDMGEEIKVVESFSRSCSRVTKIDFDHHQEDVTLPSKWEDFEDEFMVEKADAGAEMSQHLRLIEETIKRTLWLSTEETTDEHVLAYNLLGDMCSEAELWTAFDHLSRKNIVIKAKSASSSTKKFRQYCFSMKFLKRVHQLNYKPKVAKESRDYTKALAASGSDGLTFSDDQTGGAVSTIIHRSAQDTVDFEVQWNKEKV